MISLVAAERAEEKESVFVETEMVTQTIAQAPSGSGDRMRPRMVVRKMERRDQAWWVSLAGLGTKKRRMRPSEIEIRNGIGFAPFQWWYICWRVVIVFLRRGGGCCSWKISSGGGGAAILVSEK
ncbi:hypothetical protein Droror1_Dr00006043 [Drosera rotundifolia]